MTSTPSSKELPSTEQKINTVLDKVRPYIQSHGGNVRLVEIDGANATLAIEGACVGCALANLTYNKIIKTLLIEEVPEITNFILS
jgi:Fe-S cluster biogenesis protein NfuA